MFCVYPVLYYMSCNAVKLCSLCVARIDCVVLGRVGLIRVVRSCLSVCLCLCVCLYVSVCSFGRIVCTHERSGISVCINVFARVNRVLCMFGMRNAAPEVAGVCLCVCMCVCVCAVLGSALRVVRVCSTNMR